ncbi:hypothetical protein BH23PLA1_BH23PLA1_10130 [soil metagenome]
MTEATLSCNRLRIRFRPGILYYTSPNEGGSTIQVLSLSTIGVAPSPPTILDPDSDQARSHD